MTDINVAIVGYGNAGKNFHAPLIAHTPGLRLSHVLSRQALQGVIVVGDLQTLLADRTIDLIVIASPNDTHFEIARQALLAGKHVVIDKPCAATLAQARELTALAGQTGKLLSVFQNRRWDADFLTVRQIVAQGMLGEIVHFEAHFDRYQPDIRDRWKERPGTTGVWFDLGPHLVDQALQLFGPPDTVYATFAKQRAGSEVVDYFHVILTYGRRRVILHSGLLVPGRTPRFTVHGTTASYVKYGLDTQEKQLAEGKTPGGPDWGTDPEPGMIMNQPFPNQRGNYLAYYQGIRDAITTDAPNPVPARDILAVMNVLETGVRSAELGRALELQPDAR